MTKIFGLRSITQINWVLAKVFLSLGGLVESQFLVYFDKLFNKIIGAIMKYSLLLLWAILLTTSGFSQTAEDYYLKANKAFELGDLPNQVLYAEKAISLFEKENNFGLSFLNTVQILVGSYSNQFKYQKTIDLLEKVINIYPYKSDESYPLIIQDLAYTYELVENFESAEKLYLQSMQLTKTLYGEKNAKYALLLNNVGLLYIKMGNYVIAEKMIITALQTGEEVFGTNNIDYASGLNNLGLLFKSMGDYSKSEIYYQKALKITENVVGTEHPYYAIYLFNLASLYQVMGNYTKAEPLYLGAKAIIEKVFGVEHPDYVKILDKLVELYEAKGDNQKAETIRLEAKKIRGK